MSYSVQKFIVLSLMASSIMLSGCAPMGLAAGAGAAVGVASAKEGGLQSSIVDEAIRVKISEMWFRRDVDMFRKLNLNVNQGRVLVTGVVQKPEDRVEAIRIAWQPKGVKQVINEIRVGDTSTFSSYAQDTWISGQLRTRLTFEKYVQSINYSIETVEGTVYLMGVAQNQTELDRVISIARRIKGVKEVISYVKMIGEQPTDEASTYRQAGPVSPANEQTPTPIVGGEPTPLTGAADSTEGVDYGTSTVQTPPSTIQSEILPP